LPPVAAPSGRRFVDAATIRAAAVSAGLRLPQSVYANAAAGLATGKHLILTGAPGSGKTTLAMAIARAAAQTGEAHGATVVTAEHRWEPKELLLAAAAEGRWVIADELDRVKPDRALAALSTFLMGIPVATQTGAETEAAEGWRIVATWGARRPHLPAPLSRRFAFVEVLAPAADELRSAIQQAANHDATAAQAAERLLGLREIAPLGAGVFLDAARHAAARNEAAPADELTLAREAFTAYVEPLLGDLDDEAQTRVQQLLASA
jgi:MoxR-like ATPase